MFRKIFISIVLSSLSMSALSQWNAGVSYVNISESDEDGSLRLGMLAGSVGYSYGLGDGLSLIPELRYGIGIQDEKETFEVWDDGQMYQVDMTVKVDRMATLSLKLQYELDAGVYFFVAPTYNDLKLSVKASVDGFSESGSASDSEVGYSLGAGYKLTPQMSAELQYESIKSTDLIGLGLRFYFQ